MCTVLCGVKCRLSDEDRRPALDSEDAMSISRVAPPDCGMQNGIVGSGATLFGTDLRHGSHHALNLRVRVVVDQTDS